MSKRSRVARLADLPRGCPAIIAQVDEQAGELMDLGFVAGARVVPTHSGPGGDPRVYEVDGARIALRRAAARQVHVTMPAGEERSA
jgi:ferrous iron transport protein A